MTPRAALIVAFAVLAWPASVAAHGGSAASLVVPIDHVNPGESFPVIAADFGSDSVVSFSIVATERSAVLGTVTAGPDGHFDATFDLPADFPLGYADLVAKADDGSQTDIYVLVGPLSNATPPPGRGQWWQDPSILLLGIVVVGGSAILGATLIRSRRRERELALARRQRR